MNDRRMEQNPCLRRFVTRMTEPHAALRSEIVALLPRLRRFARTITRHREDADDLVQAALERALRRLDQWQPGTRLDSWMFMIVKNAWIDEVRARARRDAVLLPEEAGGTVRGVTLPPTPTSCGSTSSARWRSSTTTSAWRWAWCWSRACRTGKPPKCSAF